MNQNPPPKTHTAYTHSQPPHLLVTALTQTAVAEVLPETHVAQLAGCDVVHLQSHGGALAHRLHAHAHGLHFQYEHRHLEDRRRSRGQEPSRLDSMTSYLSLLKTLRGPAAYHVFGGVVGALGGSTDGVGGPRPLLLLNRHRFGDILFGDGVLKARDGHVICSGHSRHEHTLGRWKLPLQRHNEVIVARFCHLVDRMGTADHLSRGQK